MKPGYLVFLEGALRRIAIWGAFLNLALFGVWFAYQSPSPEPYPYEIGNTIAGVHKASFVVWSLLIVVWGAVLVASRARSTLLSVPLALLAITSSSVLFFANNDGLASREHSRENITKVESLYSIPWAGPYGSGPEVVYRGDCSRNPVYRTVTYSSPWRASLGTVFDRYNIICSPTILGVLIDSRLLFGFSPLLLLILLARVSGLKSRWEVSESERPPRYATPTTLAASFLAIVANESFWLYTMEMRSYSSFVAVFATALAAIVSILRRDAGLPMSFVLGLLLSVVCVYDLFAHSYSHHGFWTEFGRDNLFCLVSGLSLIAISFGWSSMHDGQRTRLAMPVAT